MKRFDPGDHVRYPPSSEIGVITQIHERIGQEGREQFRLTIRYEKGRICTLSCVELIQELVLVRESMAKAGNGSYEPL